jgi:serine/threonine-protein kinase RsbT
MPTEIHVTIRSDTDIVLACQKGRNLATQVGFPANDQVVIIIAISEVTRNILKYAGHGQVCLRLIRQVGRSGLTVVARDEGPGIADVEQALQDGYSTGQGLGLGLPGAKRLMDEFEIVSIPGRGTTVTMTLWLKEGSFCLVKP